MKHIAIVGAGQLGSRHLQGLANVTIPCTLYMVDPAQESLDLAKQRFCEMPDNTNIFALHSLKHISELPKQIDLAILATTADVRLKLLEGLLSQSEVKYVVLEKVLFQREDDYGYADQLLRSQGVKAWVNCPRRMFNIYKQLRDFFSEEPVLSMQVSGGDWGLGCNGVHFIDIFSYLTGKLVDSYDSGQLDCGFYPGKRPGFIEFGGTLIGRAGDSRLWLTAANGSTARHLIMLRTEQRSCIIDEQAGQAWFMNEQQGWRNESFVLPYQSQLTGDVCMAILLRGICDLPEYSASAAMHLPFIRVLQKHIAKSDQQIKICPIT